MNLSASTLQVFQKCQRCFWLDKNKKIKQPRGIFPSLPGGMDRVIKLKMDAYRLTGKLPAQLQIPGVEGIHLFSNQAALEKMRNWRSGLKYSGPEGELIGALDDLMVDENGCYTPLDYKTKGSPTSDEDAIKYYQTQLDIYALMLEANKMPPSGFGVLMYFSPSEVTNIFDGGQSNVCFGVQAVVIPTDSNRAKRLLADANFCLNNPIAPLASDECETCKYVSDRMAFGL